MASAAGSRSGRDSVGGAGRPVERLPTPVAPPSDVPVQALGAPAADAPPIVGMRRRATSLGPASKRPAVHLTDEVRTAGLAPRLGDPVEVPVDDAPLVPRCSVCKLSETNVNSAPYDERQALAFNSDVFRNWSASQGRALPEGAVTAGDHARCCLSCLTQVNKLVNQIWCSGCGANILGGRPGAATPSSIKWRTTTDTAAIEAARTYNNFTAVQPNYVAERAGALLCPACVTVSGVAQRGRSTEMEGVELGRPALAAPVPDGPALAALVPDVLPDRPRSWEDVDSDITALRAACTDMAAGRLTSLLSSMAARSLWSTLAADPVWSNSLFEQFFWKQCCVLFPHATSADKDALLKKFNISRFVSSFMAIEGVRSSVQQVSVDPASATSQFLLFTKIHHVAAALNKGTESARNPAGIEGWKGQCEAMVEELRKWGPKHAQRPQMQTSGPGVANELPTSLYLRTDLRALWESIKNECPRVYHFLEKLIPDSDDDRELDEDVNARPGRIPEYGRRRVDVKKTEADQGKLGPVPKALARRAYLASSMAFAASQRSNEPFHSLLTAIAKMDGASELFMSVMNQLGVAITARQGKRHLDLLAEMGRTRLQKSDAIPSDRWVIYAIDNLDWLSKTRQFGKPPKMAHLITAILMSGTDASLPEPTPENLKERTLPAVAAAVALLHELSKAEEDAFAAADRLFSVLAAELVDEVDNDRPPERAVPPPNTAARNTLDPASSASNGAVLGTGTGTVTGAGTGTGTGTESGTGPGIAPSRAPRGGAAVRASGTVREAVPGKGVAALGAGTGPALGTATGARDGIPVLETTPTPAPGGPAATSLPVVVPAVIPLVMAGAKRLKVAAVPLSSEVPAVSESVPLPVVDARSELAEPVVAPVPAPSRPAQGERLVTVNVLMDNGVIASVKVAQPGTAAAVIEALAARYAVHGLTAQDITLTVDGEGWSGSTPVALACRNGMDALVAAVCRHRSLRIRLQELLHHDPKEQAAQVLYGQPIVGLSSSMEDVEKAHIQQAKTAGQGTCTARLKLIGAGDFQTYAITLKLQEQGRCGWVIPWIGDFHLLWHLQCNVFDMYWSFGLRQFAELDLGNNEAALKYLEAGKRFEGNAAFLRHVVDTVGAVVDRLVAEGGGESYRRERCATDRTFAVWCQLLKDVRAVCMLHLAVRTGNFDLRQACLKRLSYLFHVEGKYNYQKLVTTHLKQIATLSPYHLALVRGHFSVALFDHPNANEACDEALEKTVNRESKNVIDRVDGEGNADRILAFQELSAGRSYLFDELGLQKRVHTFPTPFLTERNLVPWINKLRAALGGPVERTVMNIFTGVEASSVAADHMLRARDIGQHRLLQHILRFAYGAPRELTTEEKALYAKLPSKLVTMALKAPTEKQLKKALEGKTAELEVHRQVMVRLGNRAREDGAATREALAELHEAVIRDVIGIPLCFVNGDGKLRGQKSVFSSVLAKHLGIPEESVFQSVPLNMRFDIRIFDALVCIHFPPSADACTFGDYAQSFCVRFLTKVFEAGTALVVFCFDNNMSLNLAKLFEQLARRVQHSKAINLSKDLSSINDATKLPSPKRWTDSVVSVSKIRAELIRFLAEYMLNRYIFPAHAALPLRLLVDAGTGVPVERVAGRADLVLRGDLAHKNLEADYAVFFYAQKLQREWAENEETQFEPNVLISSVDTDVWINGVVLLGIGAYLCGPGHLWVEKRPGEVLDVAGLVARLRAGPVSPLDAAGLFAVGGCDYVSHWAGYSHKRILGTAVTGASVVLRTLRAAGSSAQSMQLVVRDATTGQLEIDEATYSVFVAYLYFDEHRRAFPKNTDLAALVVTSDPAATVLERCRALYNTVKAAVTYQTNDQRLRMPTYQAAQLHRLRARYVLRLPPAGLAGGDDLPDPLEHGFTLLRPSEPRSPTNFGIRWDTSSVSAAVARTTATCGCKAGCLNKRCKCNAAGQLCTVACNCTSCKNDGNATSEPTATSAGPSGAAPPAAAAPPARAPASRVVRVRDPALLAPLENEHGTAIPVVSGAPAGHDAEEPDGADDDVGPESEDGEGSEGDGNGSEPQFTDTYNADDEEEDDDDVVYVDRAAKEDCAFN